MLASATDPDSVCLRCDTFLEKYCGRTARLGTAFCIPAWSWDSQYEAVLFAFALSQDCDSPSSSRCNYVEGSAISISLARLYKPVCQHRPSKPGRYPEVLNLISANWIFRHGDSEHQIFFQQCHSHRHCYVLWRRAADAVGFGRGFAATPLQQMLPGAS